ncbi:phage tail length tape measure family protein [Nitratireductor sp. B36]|uniref:phage tail length tape measure family protein n=1 Tax=Nitratireductor sp. B36 TaxID=2762059 RepID=UPI001E3247C8|nr:phage tail length tape measure family protein [Nitratireductor sp. B36]MCC5777847.1 phage tail length tape measure family protein [Nitratireductor sp. B36]
MAVTADKVVVEMQAKVDGYMRDVGRAQTDFSKKMKKVGDDVAKAGRATAVAFDQVSGTFSRAGAGIALAGSEARMAQQHFRNLAFQFQDIGTMLAAGQSPFMLLAQQLPQITMYGGSLNGVMGALRSTVASLFSPLGLATTAFVLLASTAVSYFSDLLAQSDEADEALKRQADLIGRVADKWGEALPALKEFSEELNRLADNASLEEARQEAVNQTFRDFSNAIAEARQEMEALLPSMFELAESDQEVERLRAAFRAFNLAVKDAEEAVRNKLDPTEALNRAMKAMAGIMSNDVVSGSNSMRSALEGVISSLEAATDRAAKYNEETSRLQDRGNIPLSEFGGGRGSDPRSFVDDPYYRDRYFPDPEEPERATRTGRSRGSRSTSISEIEREKQAVVDLIDQLEFERSLIGMTAVEREKATALRRAGSAATAEQREKIAQLVEATYNENAALQAQQQAYQELEQIGMNAINSIANAFKDGKLEANEMIGIVIQLIQQLMAMKSLGGGGLLGGLFGGLFGGGGGLPGFATGTANTGGARGQPRGIVHGQEAVIPLPAGGKVPVEMRMPERASDAGGGQMDVRVFVDQDGNWQAAVERISQGSAAQVVKTYDKGNYQRFLANMGNARKRNAL